MIWVACSGTAGHVNPSYQIAQYLKAKHFQVTWVGAHGMEKRIVRDIPQVHLPMRAIRGSSWVNTMLLPWHMLISCIILIRLLINKRPKCVCLMGSYVTIPVGLIAFVFRVPIWLFEQNTSLGLANRLYKRCASVLFSGLPLACEDDRVKHLNNPVLASIREKTTYHPSIPIKVLVTGGSRGALSLNKELPEVFSQLQGKFEIHHMTGHAHLEMTQGIYQSLGIQATVKDYADLSDEYQWADLIICRSGAMTVTECAVCYLPSILVPFPYATDDHQAKNAEVLVERGGAFMVRYDSQFKQQMYALLNSVTPEKLQQMHQWLRTIDLKVNWNVLDHELNDLSK